ncbi:MAG: UDP-N-acetylmuramate dehydrogenase [Puniceicoccales bacterium]|jgi:UDP-N-acetylmuramate dehydrogenase|nr:UDP-N-acetylmuramate dehydrogenase [Puniceicoccales bacterium]
MGKILEYYPMRLLTTLRIGGPARFFAEVESAEELQTLIQRAAEAGILHCIIGRGSNLLISDDGYNGMLLRLKPKQSGGIVQADGRLAVDASVSLGRFCAFCARGGIGGFEFLCGIPGSTGGAVVMNAGAHGKNIGDCVESVRFLHKNGTVIPAAKPEFSYRHCHLDGLDALLSIDLRAENFFIQPEEIQRRQSELRQWRREHQPSGPSAGSIFKNPNGHSAGKLIDDAGLKGYAIGGAQISQIHGNFIVNRGNATCAEVLELIELIRATVRRKFAIELQLEVHYLSPSGFEII